MSKLSEEILIIDGLEYCNWNRELFEDAHKGGLNDLLKARTYLEKLIE